MDIFEYAKHHDADYYDNNTGLIYKVQDYNRCIKEGRPTPGIVVIDSFTGEFVWYVKKVIKNTEDA